MKNLIPLQREAPNEVHPKTTRRFSKQVRKAKKERFLKTLERRRQEFNVNSQQFHPINLSSRDLSDDQKSLLSKGPSFCPVPRDINRVKLLEDWEKFENRLRAAVFFHRDDVTNITSTSPHQSVFLTVKKVSGWKAPVSHVPELELFLDSVRTELFDPGKARFIHDNLSGGERQALVTLKQAYNVTIQIQD